MAKKSTRSRSRRSSLGSKKRSGSKKPTLGRKQYVAHKKSGGCPKGSREVRVKGVKRCRLNRGRQWVGRKKY